MTRIAFFGGSRLSLVDVLNDDAVEKPKIEIWNGMKFLWVEMHRNTKKPSLRRTSKEFPLVDWKALFLKLIRIIKPRY